MDRSITRSFQLLEALARARGPVRLSSLAGATCIEKSTTHRILAGLIEMGYAEQDADTRLYRATLKTWELGATIISENPVKRAAAGYLEALHNATGETVSLTVLAGDDVLYLDKLISPRPIVFTTRVGSRVPAPLTAGGKAMLALSPQAGAIAGRLAARRPGFEVPAFLAELAEVRRRGYAVASFSAGVISFGAAIAGRDIAPASALSVSAPQARLTGARRERITGALLAECARLADAMGGL
jgi:DNA-binding IclR family transcriptional regulator